MKFRLSIDCGNAAFEDHAPGEVARILRELAARMEHHASLPDVLHMFDVNGNHVGEAVTTGRRPMKRRA